LLVYFLKGSPPSPCLLQESSCSSHDSSNFYELRDQRKLSISGWLDIFLNSVEKLQKRVEDGGGDKFLVWDKDDQEAMDFVASAAVIRSQVFHLPGADQLTRFTIKSLAGNIIPAVASTNAIVAGLMVLQARHILSKHYERVRTVYLHRQPTGRRGNRRLVVPVKPAPPNPSCLVCSDTIKNSQLRLVCAPEMLTLRILRDRILIRHLGMLAPDVELSDRGVILISSEEGETDEDTLNKTLGEFNVTQDTCLQCDDFRQDFTVRLIVSCASPELANALPNNLSSSNNSLPIQQQQLDSDDQFEQWRILGNVDSVLTSVKGSNSNNSAASSSIPEEIMIMNGNVAKHEGNEKKMFLKFPPNILVNKNCLEL
uniref:Ubiquitin/SUMO-activating enzyme ubiquitin-like domain-containing protein n=1 Tax=Trichobilharzia regenti TaxID=157069 RepID=A0AA85J9W1_TRIRE